ncbi:MAG: hypothetical protein WCI05_12915 [Myxococcales bacterium]
MRGAFWLLVLVPLALACGTDAIGVDACRKVEEARCRRALACAVPLERPVSPDGNDVDTCVRFYRDACLHGLVAADPGAPALRACIDAINGGDCELVLHPELDGACAWLVPPNTPVDAGNADVVDAPGN